MRYADLFEAAIQHSKLYRGVDGKGAMAYIAQDKMVGRHSHYVLAAERQIKGLSTTFDPTKWLGMYPVIFVLDPTKITNPMYEIHGQSAYELTGWMEHMKAFDISDRAMKTLKDKRWAAEHADPDEVFVAKGIAPLHVACIGIQYRTVPTKLSDALTAYGDKFGIAVTPAPQF